MKNYHSFSFFLTHYELCFASPLIWFYYLTSASHSTSKANKFTYFVFLFLLFFLSISSRLSLKFKLKTVGSSIFHFLRSPLLLRWCAFRKGNLSLKSKWNRKRRRGKKHRIHCVLSKRRFEIQNGNRFGSSGLVCMPLTYRIGIYHISRSLCDICPNRCLSLDELSLRLGRASQSKPSLRR